MDGYVGYVPAPAALEVGEHGAPSLIWCDLETTCLLPEKGVILELGLAITDAELRLTTKPLQVIIHHPFLSQPMDPVVSDMHRKSGLLNAVRSPDGALTWPNAWSCALGYISDHGLNTKQVPLCGSTIGFDRAWLKYWAPALESVFHYRSVDVSSIKELVKRWYPNSPALQRQPPSRKLHRVLPDLEDSINELRYYRDNFFEEEWRLGTVK